MASQFDNDQHEFEINWDSDAIVNRRNTYYAASQRAFVPYKTPLIFHHGQDQYLWDEKGNRYLDCLSQNLTVSVGYNNPVVTREVQKQSESMQHCTTMFFHPVPAHYAEELTKTMPEGEDWVVHFMNSGAEAIDMAMLLARSYTGNTDIISLTNSYHGATFGAQSITGISGFRHNVPLLGGIQFTAVPDQYRGIHGEGVEPYLEELDRTIHFGTSDNLAGMFIEPIQGYGGIVHMPKGYIKGAQERVKAKGGLLIVDEVQSGVGRTGDNFWSFEEHNVIPDIVVTAKGIGNGYPLGAVIARREVAEAMANKFYFNTYGANPVSCSAGRAVLHVIQHHKLQENARLVGAKLLDVLKDLQTRHDIIGDVRGQGLMMAVELVKNRDSKEPAPEEMIKLFELTRENGLIASKSGAYRNVLRICPPLCFQMEDVEFFKEAINKSFDSL
ncbi:MAG: alanine-glyoxylate transaminase/(R)-3-amino-2-methylpropionate-pyruvate transaminase [Gammaproteobacteria bacterium]|jgi:alanine-glyoxylate transaminase/(R)-3-amino-2-methylpropionate-pyruvate transaminase